MLEHFRQAPSALCRDARPLFQCQGVVGRFDFDERPLADWACVQCDIQGRRVWIERQVGGQGSVIGRLGLPPDDLPHLRHPLEIPSLNDTQTPQEKKSAVPMIGTSKQPRTKKFSSPMMHCSGIRTAEWLRRDSGMR